MKCVGVKSTTVDFYEDERETIKIVEEWDSSKGPNVPVIVKKNVWDILVFAAKKFERMEDIPRVFSLYMERRKPLIVVDVREITNIWKNKLGVIRWEEPGGYPSVNSKMRKGGVAFIRGDTELRLEDV